MALMVNGQTVPTPDPPTLEILLLALEPQKTVCGCAE